MFLTSYLQLLETLSCRFSRISGSKNCKCRNTTATAATTEGRPKGPGTIGTGVITGRSEILRRSGRRIRGTTRPPRLNTRSRMNPTESCCSQFSTRFSQSTAASFSTFARRYNNVKKCIPGVNLIKLLGAYEGAELSQVNEVSRLLNLALKM